MEKLIWRKSSRSNGLGGECVEVAATDDVVFVRDSKDPDGPKLAFAPDRWSAFIDATRSGEFDAS